MLPCEIKGCEAEGIECRIYDIEAERYYFEFLCVEHARKSGYCGTRGELWSGYGETTDSDDLDCDVIEEDH